MAWHITGDYYAPCSCNVGCPCLLGELEADRGWCSAVLILDIRGGNADGTDVSGAKAALVADWPGGFLGGNGTGRLYFDLAVSQQQRSVLEPVLSGKKGGVFEAVGALIPQIQPSQGARVNVQKGTDETRITVGDFLDLTVRPLRGATGEMTRLLHGAASFREEVILSKTTGFSRPPGLRQWESGGGHGEQADFDWSG